MRVHLIDGSHELLRAHFGAAQARAQDGLEVGAVRGMLRSLVAWLRRDEVTHVASAFDHGSASIRGPRPAEDVDPALTAQFSLAQACTRALGFVTLCEEGFEAGDLLATAVMRLRENVDVEQVRICAPNRELAQCVRAERVVLFDRVRRQVIDEAGVLANFGVPPSSVPDWLALVGDALRGVPGVPGWSARAAASVLSRYLHLEGIPSDPSAWEVFVKGAQSLSAALKLHRDRALQSRALATLRADAPLRETVSELRWQGADRPALERLCAELDDPATLDRVPRWQ